MAPGGNQGQFMAQHQMQNNYRMQWQQWNAGQQESWAGSYNYNNVPQPPGKHIHLHL